MGKTQYSMFVLGLAVGLFVLPLVAQAGLIGFWEFEEGAGDVVADSSGMGHNATIFNPGHGLGENGSVWATDAERGSVASFAGTETGSYILAGDALIPAMTFDTDFTWAFWVKQAVGNADNNIIVGNRMSIDKVDFVPRQFIKFTPTKFEYHTEGNGNDNLDYADVVTGVWLHQVVVKKGKLLTFYLNGVEGGTQVLTQELYDPQPLFFGGDNEGAAGEMWTGYLDNVRIYDSALTATAVAVLYATEGGVTSGISEWDWELMN